MYQSCHFPEDRTLINIDAAINFPSKVIRAFYDGTLLITVYLMLTFAQMTVTNMVVKKNVFEGVMYGNNTRRSFTNVECMFIIYLSFLKCRFECGCYEADFTQPNKIIKKIQAFIPELFLRQLALKMYIYTLFFQI